MSQSGRPEKEQYDAYVGQIARGAGVSSFGQGIGRVLNYATQVALARMYGPAALGLYVLGVTTIYFVNIISQFGMDSGVVRFIARYRAERDDSRIRGTIVLALGITLGLSLVFSVLMFAGAGALANGVFGKPALEPVFRAFSVALPLLTFMNMAVYAVTGFQTTRGAHRRSTYVRQVVQPLVNLIFIVAFYFLGAQILGAVAAYMISMAVGGGLALYYLWKIFPGLFDPGTPAKYEPRSLLKVSGPMIVAGFANYVNPWITVTVLGVFATAEAVGIFNAAARTAALSTLVLFAFTGIFSPMISNLHSRGSLEHLRYIYSDVSRWTFTGSLAVFLLTALLARDIMAVFGSTFVSGWSVMVLIAGAYLFSSSVGHTGRLLAMTGHQKLVMTATVGATVACVALNFALVPFYGLIGAATATSAAIVVSNAATLFFVRRIHGFWPYNRAYLKSAAAGALAFAAAYLVKLVLPIPSGLLTLLVISPIFLAAFAAFVFASGLSPSDRQFLGILWGKIRRTIGRDAPDPSR